MRSANPIKNSRARSLRRAQTDVEKKLWNCLRNRQIEGFKFVRQEPVGFYFPDFVCRETRIIVELDGSQHFENAHDERRDTWLQSEGYTLMRFWNHEVNENLEGVLEMIRLKLLEKR
jgi:very-short-patch-repair endonuclease